VAVHSLHQHDAVRPDLKSEFVLDVVRRLEIAVRNSLKETQPVTHIASGAAQVYQVASSRRILGPDGKIKASRYTTTTDPALRAEPEV